MTQFEKMLCDEIDAFARIENMAGISKQFTIVDSDHLRLNVKAAERESSEVIEIGRSKMDLDYRMERLNVLVGGLVERSKFN